MSGCFSNEPRLMVALFIANWDRNRIFFVNNYFYINLQIKPPLSVESSIMWKKSPNQMKILNIRDCLLSLSIISFPPEKKKPKTCQFWSEYAKTDARALIWCPPGICTWKGHRILTRCKLLPNISREKIEIHFSPIICYQRIFEVVLLGKTWINNG